jgi:hypothetical protein
MTQLWKFVNFILPILLIISLLCTSRICAADDGDNPNPDDGVVPPAVVEEMRLFNKAKAPPSRFSPTLFWQLTIGDLNFNVGRFEIWDLGINKARNKIKFIVLKYLRQEIKFYFKKDMPQGTFPVFFKFLVNFIQTIISFEYGNFNFIQFF